MDNITIWAFEDELEKIAVSKAWLRKAVDTAKVSPKRLKEFARKQGKDDLYRRVLANSVPDSSQKRNLVRMGTKRMVASTAAWKRLSRES